MAEVVNVERRGLVVHHWLLEYLVMFNKSVIGALFLKVLR